MKFQFIVNQMISLFFICIFSVSVSGQEIIWGEKQKSPERAAHINQFIKSNNSHTYAVRGYATNKMYLEKFDKNLNLISSDEIDLTYEKKDRLYINMICVNDKVFLITYLYNKKQKKSYLFAQDFDLDKNKTISEPKVIASVEDDIPLFPMSAIYTSSIGIPYNLKISNDKSKIVVVHDIAYQNDLAYRNKASEKILVNVFDKEFNPIWETTKTFDFLDKDNSIKDINIDNDGNVYVSTILKEMDERGRKKVGEDFIIYEWSNNGESLIPYKINLEDAYPSSVKVIEHNGKTKIVGRYSLVELSGSSKGIYFGELSKQSKKIENIVYNSFNVDDFEMIYSIKQFDKLKANKDEFHLSFLEIADVIIDNDNNITLLGEQRYSTTTGVGQDAKTNYIYSHIVILSYSEDLSPKYTKIIQKRGESRIKSFSGSFVSEVHNSKICIVYFYNGKPRNRKSKVVNTTPKDDFQIFLSVIDKNGNQKDIKSKEIFHQLKHTLRSEVSILTNNNELIFYIITSGKSYSLGKVTFE